jgi:hypothetical protein
MSARTGGRGHCVRVDALHRGVWCSRGSKYKAWVPRSVIVLIIRYDHNPSRSPWVSTNRNHWNQCEKVFWEGGLTRSLPPNLSKHLQAVKLLRVLNFLRTKERGECWNKRHLMYTCFGIKQRLYVATSRIINYLVQTRHQLQQLLELIRTVATYIQYMHSASSGDY